MVTGQYFTLPLGSGSAMTSHSREYEGTSAAFLDKIHNGPDDYCYIGNSAASAGYGNTCAGFDSGPQFLTIKFTAYNSRNLININMAMVQKLISPNVDRSVIEKTKELGLISMPGAFTPSEIVDAYNYGGDIIKLFPAGLLGVSYIKAVRGPLSHIPMAAVGGVTPENICQFTAAGVACFGIGSNLVNQSLTVSHDFENLTERALAFRNALGE